MKIFERLCLCLGGLLALCGCSGADLLNLTIPRDGYMVHRDIAYGDGPRQQLDIYVPDQLAPGQPVIVFFYGGSWQWGSKDDYRFVGQAFASRGFITVIADYRLYPAARFPDFLYDCAAATVWTHHHSAAYGGNPRNLFVAGHSAGGYNAVMLAANDAYLRQAGGKPDWIRGAIGIAGPYDFLPLTDPRLIEIFGGDRNAASQPISYVRPGLPPMLLLAGEDDSEVLPRNAVNMAEKLRADGDAVETRFYPDLAHIGIALSLANGFRSKAPTLQDISAFIMAHTATP